MPLGALGLALGAAVLHALWNLLVAGARDTQLATAAALVSGVAVLAPVALIVGGIPTRSLPWIAASATIELTYFTLLAAAYQVGELSVTYPLARGLAPVFLVAVGAATGIGGAVAGVEVAGVALVAIGIVAVRGVGTRGRARELLLAVAIGACIAGYTLVDREGIQGARPLTYLWLVLALATPPYALVLWRARGGAALRARVHGEDRGRGPGHLRGLRARAHRAEARCECRQRRRGARVQRRDRHGLRGRGAA